MSYESDPQWHLIQWTSEEDEAFRELEARLDRADDHASPRDLGGAAPYSRPTAALLAVKDGDSCGHWDSSAASPSSAAGRSVAPPLSSSPSAAGILLNPPPSGVPAAHSPSLRKDAV